MANRPRPWVMDLKVFAGLTLLNAGLVFVAVNLELNLRAQPVWLECWYWAFAAPVMAARGVPEVWLWRILAVNPLLSGLVWWSMWKLFKLFRTKPIQ